MSQTNTKGARYLHGSFVEGSGGGQLKSKGRGDLWVSVGAWRLVGDKNGKERCFDQNDRLKGLFFRSRRGF